MVSSNIKWQFDGDIEKIWHIVTDNSNYAWRSDLAKIDIIDDKHFIEYNKKGYPTFFTITSKEKFKEYRFDIENTNINGKWIGIFNTLANGQVEIDFTEEIETSKVMMKLLAKPYLKRMQKRYLKDLEKELNKKLEGKNKSAKDNA